MKILELIVRSLALILAAVSLFIFLKGYKLAYDLALTHDAEDFTGGRGFVLNAPLMILSMNGLLVGACSFGVFLIALYLARKNAIKSPAIIATVLLLLPFGKACWVVLRMLIKYGIR